MVEDELAPSEVFGPGDRKLPVDDQTIRVTLTPTRGGSTLRVHLSNRFGTAPVTFSHVTIGRQASGATLQGPPVSLTFGAGHSVTVPAGRDVISDPARLAFRALQPLEVSVYVASDAGMATEHYVGRQTTYFTPDEAGDHSADIAGGAFLLQNSTRPFVDAIDVLARARAGAVVAFGDSITDGYQAANASGVPASPEGFDLNERWPDDLARRLIAAGIPLSVLNAGISGNMVLEPGTFGGGPDVYGPSALSRLKQDVLDQVGVTTVIWLEGINDIGQRSPPATAAQIEAGYVEGIDEMHAAGLRVLQGTLTPAGGNPANDSYGGPVANQERMQINHWILTESPADGVIDFAAAVADPSDPSRLNPAYSGADDLHPNPAGYQAMANAVNLSLLRRNVCTRSPLRVRVTPRDVRADSRVTLHIRVTARGIGPVPAATITLDGRRAHTKRTGKATITVRFNHAGRFRILVTARGYSTGTKTIYVRKRKRPEQDVIRSPRVPRIRHVGTPSVVRGRMPSRSV